MADYRKDDIFKEIAKQYIEVYGNVLLEEKAEIERQKIMYLTPRTDGVIKPLIKKRKRGAAIKIVAGIAAAVILAVSIPAILNRTGMYSPENETASDSNYDGEYSEEGVVMPLTFALPYGYTVADSKLDNGQSVYNLDNITGDNVVMTMEGAEAAKEYNYNELGSVYIDGQYVNGLSTADYHMLVFEYGGVFYTLSCKYNLGTIVTLYREIVY